VHDEHGQDSGVQVTVAQEFELVLVVDRDVITGVVVVTQTCREQPHGPGITVHDEHGQDSGVQVTVVQEFELVVLVVVAQTLNWQPHNPVEIVHVEHVAGQGSGMQVALAHGSIEVVVDGGGFLEQTVTTVL